MHLPIKREPPPIEEVVQRMKARIEREGLRVNIEAVSALQPVSSKSRERSERSRRHCHLPAEPKKPRHPRPRDTGAYVPEMSARVEDDRNLTDGARHCARKVTEYVYRKNREGRQAEITVTYLVKALGRCRRSVQRYLRQLEREGYIEVHVVPSQRTRMCFGLLVRLLTPCCHGTGGINGRRRPENGTRQQSHRSIYKGLREGLYSVRYGLSSVAKEFGVQI